MIQKRYQNAIINTPWQILEPAKPQALAGSRLHTVDLREMMLKDLPPYSKLE